MAKNDLEVPEAAGASIVTAGSPSFSDDQLREVGSFQDAIDLAAEQYGVVQDFAEEYGTGFDLLDDKSQLVGKELLLMQWRINDGDYGGFASVVGVTKDGLKFIINDGSTGIFKQLYEISATSDRNGGLRVRKGLRRSEYPTCGQCDKPRSAMEAECEFCGDTSEARHRGSTYYLDQSGS
jgi:hypothetical protein